MNAPEALAESPGDSSRATKSAPLRRYEQARCVSPKINDDHRHRLAVVYVRQSTAAQVMEHRESTELQYNLRYRAIDLGWPPERVTIIDDDQGQSGSSAEHRLGFQRLMAEVSLGHIGMILGIEMSRLARCNKDWHQLLELCAIFGTLLADQDGVYDPADYNDRLLLGLKGTLSEAELHILKSRMQHGKRNKAERGELYTHLPRGFVKSAGGVMLDPDEQVQSVLRLCFAKFDQLGSGRRLLRWLLDHDIRLPLRPTRGPERGELQWTHPTPGAIYKLLHHPLSAGAYSYGRCRIDPRAKALRRPGRGRVSVPLIEWPVLKQDHLPGYITWEQYLANLKQLAQNAFRVSSRGAARQGQTLLGGVIRCARCGRRMSVVYCDRNGQGRYVCHAAEPGSRCQSLQARDVDRLVEQQALAALQPASLDLSLNAAGELEAQRRQLDVEWRQRLQRASYAAQLAQRQYNAVDPDNRLVARELERRWEQALGEEQRLREEYTRFEHRQPGELDAGDRAAIQSLAASIPALWWAPTTTAVQRKTILRHLVDDVTVDVLHDTEVVDVSIHWVGDFRSQHQLRRSVQRYEQLEGYDRLRQRLEKLRQQGKTADQIAHQLNREGFRTPRGKAFRDITVQTLLVRSRMTGDQDALANLYGLPGQHRWSLPRLVQELGIPTTTLCHWCRRGWLHAVKNRSNRWTIWADDQELERLRKLAAYQRPQNGGSYPRELTTPRPLNNASNDPRPPA